MLSVSDVPESESAAKSAVTSVVVSLEIVSVDFVSFPAVSVDVTVVVSSPSAKELKSTLSTEYEPSSFSVISSVATVIVVVPSVTVIESIVDPTSTFPAISDEVASLAFITSSPLSSVISVEFVVVVSTVTDWVAVSVFPAVSVDVIVRSCVPSANSVVVIE